MKGYMSAFGRYIQSSFRQALGDQEIYSRARNIDGLSGCVWTVQSRGGTQRSLPAITATTAKMFGRSWTPAVFKNCIIVIRELCGRVMHKQGIVRCMKVANSGLESTRSKGSFPAKTLPAKSLQSGSYCYCQGFVLSYSYGYDNNVFFWLRFFVGFRAARMEQECVTTPLTLVLFRQPQSRSPLRCACSVQSDFCYEPEP